MINGHSRNYTICLGVATAFALAACATTPGGQASTTPSTLKEIVTVSVGPCFGLCPVYDVSVTPGGLVQFTGTRHTAVLGHRIREVGPGAYVDVAKDLLRFRPATGTETVVECGAAVSDTSSFTVTWTSTGGTKTVAKVQSGCPSGPGKALGALLRDLPLRLGIAGWAKQTTRPEVSRG